MDTPSPVYKVGTLTYTKPALTVLFFWLLWGDFCYQMMEGVAPSIMPLKLKALGASDTVLAITLSTIPWTMGMFLNPIISFRSDRFRSRWGRRIPFIAASLPFLVVCLVALGFGDRIGPIVYAHGGAWLKQFSPHTVTIGVLAVLLIVFTFFNTFMNSVFWYLFNDVVPEHLLARFMSWFRMVGLGSVSLYNIFIFQFAESHTAEIFVGAAILYLVGFGLMCYFVKEGQYPPPPPYVDGQSGVIAAAKTYATECHTLPHYWFQFLSTALGSIAGSGVAFMVFFYQNLGLNLAQIGQLNSCVTVVSAILIIASGWLADRIHPIRVVMIGVFANMFIAQPLLMIWLFWQPSPAVAYWVLIGISIMVTAPISALVGVWDPPLFMRLFPRSRYGQFCSANAIWRSFGAIIGSASIGIFLDTVRHFAGAKRAYFFIAIWQFVFNLPATWMAWRLYKSWKFYGGDENYMPPISVPGRAEEVPADIVL